MRQSSRIAVMCNRCWFWCDTITEIIHNALIFDIYKNGCESSLSTYAYIILLLLFIFLSILFIFVVFAIFVQMAVCCFLSHFILPKWNRTVRNRFCLVFFSLRSRSFLSFLLYTLFGDDLIWICYFIFEAVSFGHYIHICDQWYFI